MAPEQVGRAGNALTRKLGPLPVWAWAGITGGALYVYRSRSSSASPGAQDVQSGAPQGVNPDTGLPWNIDPDTGQPYGASSGAGDTTGDAGTTDGPSPTTPGTTPETGTTPAPAKRPPKGKKKRRPHIKIRRKPKHRGPSHGRKGQPAHHPPRGRGRKVGPGSRPHRDRKGVHAGHPNKGHRHKPRHKGAKAGSSHGGRPPILASFRMPARASSRAHEQGGRGHEGGLEHTALARPRPAAKAQPAARRNRPPAKPQAKAPVKSRTEPAPKHEQHRASSRGSRAAHHRRRK